jgi:hypothetical protein
MHGISHTRDIDRALKYDFMAMESACLRTSVDICVELTDMFSCVYVHILCVIYV